MTDQISNKRKSEGGEQDTTKKAKQCSTSYSPLPGVQAHYERIESKAHIIATILHDRYSFKQQEIDQNAAKVANSLASAAAGRGTFCPEDYIKWLKANPRPLDIFVLNLDGTSDWMDWESKRLDYLNTVGGETDPDDADSEVYTLLVDESRAIVKRLKNSGVAFPLVFDEFDAEFAAWANANFRFISGLFELERVTVDLNYGYKEGDDDVDPEMETAIGKEAVIRAYVKIMHGRGFTPQQMVEEIANGVTLEHVNSIIALAE